MENQVSPKIPKNWVFGEGGICSIGVPNNVNPCKQLQIQLGRETCRRRHEGGRSLAQWRWLLHGVSAAMPVSELKAAVQQHLQHRLKLTANGRQLDLTATLSEAGLQDGDVVVAVVQLGQLAAARKAFAWHGLGGEIVTWGDPEAGGDSSRVLEQLRNVEHIQATLAAFAAILESGSIVTWGDPEYGGDSSQVQEQLRNVQHIQSTSGQFGGAFADRCADRNLRRFAGAVGKE